MDSPRTHGYSKKGQRCYGTQDWHARGRTNAIGAIEGFTFLTLTLFDSTINSDVFYSWLTQDLLPKVPKGAILVMDNATFHKRHDMIQAIQDNGCSLEFLPPYSPDLNPIEKKWAQAKAIRKRHRCCVDELFSIYCQYAELY